ncbi:hypothetical protein HOE31_04795 [bacterium]|jgi:hypothetical protein|nr:hypothetical protein [bacterium]MBT4122238.1 hypothetical protein [bacterium]
MPGNELIIVEYLLNNLGNIELPLLGIISEIGSPKNGPDYTILSRTTDIGQVISEDAKKKADIYLNGKGISLKQSGSSFSYNRLQRADLKNVYEMLNFNNIPNKLSQIDDEVSAFHNGQLDRRDRPWRNFFVEADFKALLNFLMMKGSPNNGISEHPAEFILEAPIIINSLDDIKVFTFDNYFNHYKDKFVVSIRRQWIGQDSRSEHARALGLSKKEGNLPWVFDNVVGQPRSGWKNDWNENDRKTVYFLMLTKLS